MHCEELPKSIIDHRNPDWEPEWNEYKFAAFLRCNTCHEIVVCSGSGGVEMVPTIIESLYEDCGADPADYFEPKHFDPPLKLFVCPDNTPESVRERLNESFKLFFSDSEASANKARSCVEELLTELRVPRKAKKRGGGLRWRMPDERIKMLPKKYDRIKDVG